MSARVLRLTTSPRPSLPRAEREFKNAPAMLAVFERIAQERLRQKQLLKAGRILFNCDSPIVSDDRKLRVATEELGEVAREIDLIEQVRSGRRMQHSPTVGLVNEITQLAAVCVAWLETFENTARGRKA